MAKVNGITYMEQGAGWKINTLSVNINELRKILTHLTSPNFFPRKIAYNISLYMFQKLATMRENFAGIVNKVRFVTVISTNGSARLT